jgi:chromosome segregation ATPase
MFEDSSKQLCDSASIQIKLADKLEESQKIINDLSFKHQSLEADFQEKNAELQNRISNLEGLTEAYEHEIQLKKLKIEQLENELKSVSEMLNEAKHEIENEKYELSNLETVRKDLEAQRSFFTKELQESDIKGT